MEKKQFRSGDIAPVSGNYQFVKHEGDAADCIPRFGAYLHLMKGMKLPLHDECQEPSVWSLMTITEEENDPRIKGM
jgi:hypothetical protein